LTALPDHGGGEPQLKGKNSRNALPQGGRSVQARSFTKRQVTATV
jgi:hypothetical protein